MLKTFIWLYIYIFFFNSSNKS